jgi:hypothetical protein
MSFEASTEEAPFTPEQEAAFRQVVLDRALTDLAPLSDSLTDEQAFVHLPRAAVGAFHLERFSDAKVFAERAISLAPVFRTDWNYGNAVHLGHTVLGLLALREGDVDLAADELRKSGDTPGSPQLNTFGPTMQLAKELLQAGHIAPVLSYLKQCRGFWRMGSTWLDLWESEVSSGHIPNFFGRSYA